ncbi:hypothetical protein, partial [Rhizobium ruizarguesonis]|uniref:hypothetical protein n=1 Tax=Rhizobium ruizarguesonis TaxID=2081791 RepID=UPI001A8E9650
MALIEHEIEAPSAHIHRSHRKQGPFDRGASPHGEGAIQRRCCHVKFLWLERSAARGYSGDTGRNFPCIESFEPMVANCLRG